MNSFPDKRRQLNCVLCVDDEEDLQSIIKISLERRSGIKAHFCTDPRQAMARAREVKPDSILPRKLSAIRDTIRDTLNAARPADSP